MWGNPNKKKVLVLNGSPKQNKSTTMVVTNAFIEGLRSESDIDLEIINVQNKPQAIPVKPSINT